MSFYFLHAILLLPNSPLRHMFMTYVFYFFTKKFLIQISRIQLHFILHLLFSICATTNVPVSVYMHVILCLHLNSNIKNVVNTTHKRMGRISLHGFIQIQGHDGHGYEGRLTSS